MKRRDKRAIPRGRGIGLMGVGGCSLILCAGLVVSQAGGAEKPFRPQSLEDRFRAAEEALRAGKPQECEALVKPFAHQKDARVHSLLGRAYEAMRNPSLAILHFMKALSADTNDIEANRGLGRIYLGMGLADTALPYYERLVRLAPNDAAAWLALGRIQLRRREPLEAAQALQRAVELDPANLEATRELDNLLTGRRAHAEPLHVARPTVHTGNPFMADALEAAGGRQ